MTALINQLTLAVFAEAGELTLIESVDLAAIDSNLVEIFSTRLKWLSGDLDLPLEGTVPDEHDLTYRITSDGSNAYVFYYHQNQIVHLSLMLLGGDDEAEQEMVDSVRLLMLDETDDDELDEEAAVALLQSSKFDFSRVTDRPAVCSISLESSDSRSNVGPTSRFGHIETHLAWAFGNRAAISDLASTKSSKMQN